MILFPISSEMRSDVITAAADRKDIKETILAPGKSSFSRYLKR
jgi:hypothetical protein